MLAAQSIAKDVQAGGDESQLELFKKMFLSLFCLLLPHFFHCFLSPSLSHFQNHYPFLSTPQFSSKLIFYLYFFQFDILYSLYSQCDILALKSKYILGDQFVQYLHVVSTRMALYFCHINSLSHSDLVVIGHVRSIYNSQRLV